MKSDGGRGATFPSAIDSADPASMPGGCDMGGGRCTQPVELEVFVPGLRARRLTCRDHAGWWMYAATPTGTARASLMVVRRVVA